jgi:hypothetical protein
VKKKLEKLEQLFIAISYLDLEVEKRTKTTSKCLELGK